MILLSLIRARFLNHSCEVVHIQAAINLPPIHSGERMAIRESRQENLALAINWLINGLRVAIGMKGQLFILDHPARIFKFWGIEVVVLWATSLNLTVERMFCILVFVWITMDPHMIFSQVDLDQLLVSS